MEEYVKPAGSFFGRVLFATIANIFIVLSMMVICVGAFTKNVGYKATVFDKDGKEIATYSYHESQGKDQKGADYEKQGYTVKKINDRSELSGKGLTTFNVTSTVISVALLTAFIYSKLWELGTRDSNAVHFGRKKKNTFRGLKIGLLGMLPFFLILILFFIFDGLTGGFYAIINANFYAINRAITGVGAFGDVSVARRLSLILPLLFAPLIGQLAYFLGCKNISIDEKLIYKNKKKR